MNARQAFHLGAVGPRQNMGPFREELPKPAEWDQLLAKLALSDSQALEAVKSDGEASEQLRVFVSRFFGHYFVPEDVIKAVRHRKEKHLAVSLASRPAAINSNAIATTCGDQG